MNFKRLVAGRPAGYSRRLPIPFPSGRRGSASVAAGEGLVRTTYYGFLRALLRDFGLDAATPRLLGAVSFRFARGDALRAGPVSTGSMCLKRAATGESNLYLMTGSRSELSLSTCEVFTAAATRIAAISFLFPTILAARSRIAPGTTSCSTRSVASRTKAVISLASTRSLTAHFLRKPSMLEVRLVLRNSTQSSAAFSTCPGV
jgi:hypothetical protein